MLSLNRILSVDYELSMAINFKGICEMLLDNWLVQLLELSKVLFHQQNLIFPV